MCAREPVPKSSVHISWSLMPLSDKRMNKKEVIYLSARIQNQRHNFNNTTIQQISPPGAGREHEIFRNTVTKMKFSAVVFFCWG